MHHLIRALFSFVRLVTGGRIRASRKRPMEGNAATMGVREMLWWAYKFYGKPVTEPQPDAGIREHFASHGLEGFAEQADLAGQAGLAQPTDLAQQADPAKQADKTGPSRLTIALAGDILPSPNINAVSAARLFDDLEDTCLTADLRYANLESPVVATRPVCWPDENITSPPRMNNSEEVFDLLHRSGSGINVFSTANNHSLDQGAGGLLATLDFLDRRHATHTGTARTPAERDAVLVTEANGIRVAWLSWTFSLNREQLPEGQAHLVNHLRLNLPGCDIAPLERQIRSARERYGADVVVACLHWGLEYESFPQRHVIELGHRLVEAGVDIVVGNHPHGLQPAERHVYETPAGRMRSGLVIYALGDLVSDMPQAGNSALTAVAHVDLARAADGSVAITDARMRPFYSYRRYDAEGSCVELRLLDFRALQRRIADGDLVGSPPLTSQQVAEVVRLGTLLDTLSFDRRVHAKG
jgi:poly-gamma-glutamate synthesis protein (capsule biosynthesis protein)